MLKRLERTLSFMPLKRSESRSIYETFTYQNTTTSPQQSHPFTLSEDCNCDVLILGGGGAGDRQAGGGGGGGAVLYAISVTARCWLLFIPYHF